jgi:hypothetical protein
MKSGIGASTLSIAAVALLVACGSDASSEPLDAVARSTLPGVSGELILTRQRDLLDRGLINARVQNRSASSLLLEDIQLDADMFDSEPAADRPISVRSGRRVAIQVPYGEVRDCEADTTVTARLMFTFTSDDDPTPREGVVELEGTDLLDVIRAEQCVERRLADATVMSFGDPRTVDGRVVTDLVIQPTGDATGLSITDVAGTILVSARTPQTWSGATLDGPVTIPLEFVVNRCDPHALAEVTKRYGLDLAVVVDDADPVAVAVDVTPLVGLFDTIVEQCRVSSTGD